jgi:hypothetical protein
VAVARFDTGAGSGFAPFSDSKTFYRLATDGTIETGKLICDTIVYGNIITGNTIVGNTITGPFVEAMRIKNIGDISMNLNIANLSSKYYKYEYC